MKVLITTQPADGHLNPMLGLSAALRGAGHEVLFATSASFVARVEARGENAVAVGRDWLESDGPTEPPVPDADPTGFEDIFERVFLRSVALEMADDLIDLMGEVRPDVLIRESVEFAGSAAAVYVSFGTVFPRHFPEVLNAAAAGAAATGRTTVVTYGASADPDTLDLPRAERVHSSEYVPQGPVLDRCDVAVTHGGTGTTLGALARGVPVVVVPLGADQYAHARRSDDSAWGSSWTTGS